MRGCSNILVSSGVSQDGNILVGDNDDSSKRHGLVTHFNGGHHPGDVYGILFNLFTMLIFVQRILRLLVTNNIGLNRQT